MELAQILDSLSSDGGTKTASAQGSLENTGTTNKLAAALDAAVAEVDNTTKTASDNTGTPTEDLTKIATRLANAEQEALIKEAELYGAALCDGFMSRMNQYEGDNTTKTASYNSGEGATFEKFASENPELVKQAAEIGYRETKHQLEKVASDAYTEGYVKTAEVIKQAAEHCAQQGAIDTYNVLKSLRG